MPMHAPYRNPVHEFGLWIIWTFARFVVWIYQVSRLVARLLRCAGRWLAGRAIRLERHLVEILADLRRIPEPGEFSLLHAIVVSLLAGLAVWIVVMVVAR